MSKKKSAIILVGETIECFHTLKQILETDCLISGVIFCNQNSFWSRFKYEIKTIKKYGIVIRVSQIILSIYYKIYYRKSDSLFLKKSFNALNFNVLRDILIERQIPYLRETHFHSDRALRFLAKQEPHFLVSHSPYWVEKRVRNSSIDKIVLGGHPGIVPHYRGAHSSFWCIYDGLPQVNGYSIFLLDSGIDSGPVIKQEYCEYDYSISYKSNDLILMKKIASSLAEISAKYSNGGVLDTYTQEPLIVNQVRPQPGIFDFLSFKRKLSSR